MKDKKKPRGRRVYANRVNLTGLYLQEPIACTLRRSEIDRSWLYVDDDGDFTISPNQVQTQIRDGFIEVRSYSRSEVKAWTEGAKAVMTMLRDWAHE